MLTSYVFGEKYIDFVPFFIFGAQQSYPEYFVKIFISGQMNDQQRKALSLVKGENYIIVENFFDNEAKTIQAGIEIKNSGKKVLRWLIPYRELKEFDYAYMGDVDFLLFKETPSLLQAHIRHLKQIGLPFSNAIRKDSSRLTGLHFIHVASYYEKMDTIISEYLLNKSKIRVAAKKHEKDDEEFLYKIIKQGIGFGGIEEKIIQGGEYFYRPHHGSHLGVLRGEKMVKMRAPEYINHPTLNKMLQIIPQKSVLKLQNIANKKM